MTSSTPPRPAGHALVEALVAQGVDTVFGVPGESFLAVLDGFHEHRDRIRFIACRQEGGAALHGRGAGQAERPAGHLLRHARAGRDQRQRSACTPRSRTRTPMILFIGQVASDQRDREAFQEVDYRQMFGPGTLGFAKWVGEIARRRPPARVRRRAPSTPRCRAGPGRWCWCCPKTC